MVEALQQIRGERMHEIYMAFSFQETNPAVLRSVSSLCSAKFGLQTEFLAEVGKNSTGHGRGPGIITLS